MLPCCCFVLKEFGCSNMCAACVACWIAGRQEVPSKKRKRCKLKSDDWHVADEAALDLFPLFEDLL